MKDRDEKCDLPKAIREDAAFREELARQACEQNFGPDDPRDDEEIMREASSSEAWRAALKWAEKGHDDEVPWGRGKG